MFNLSAKFKSMIARYVMIVELSILAIGVGLNVFMMSDYFSFADTSWLYLFGNLFIEGRVPYRDFVFTYGPLTLFLEYAASFFFVDFERTEFLGVLARVTSGFIAFLLLRKFTFGVLAAVIGCLVMLHPLFFYTANWPSGWDQVISLSLVLMFWQLASAVSQAELTSNSIQKEAFQGRMLFSVGFGLLFFLMLINRQSTALVALPMLFLFMALQHYLFRSNATFNIVGKFYSPQVVAISLAVLLSTFVFWLAYNAALENYLEEVWISASTKKNVTLVRGIIDGLSGGGAYYNGHAFSLIGVMKSNFLPLVISALTLLLLHPKAFEKTPAAMATCVIVLISVTPFFAPINHASIWSDFPRVFVYLASFVYFFEIVKTGYLGALSPKRYGTLFFILLGNIVAMSIAFAYELSHPGRGWHNSGVISVCAMANLLFIANGKKIPVDAKSRNLAGVIVCFPMLFWGFKAITEQYIAGMHPFAENHKTDYPGYNAIERERRLIEGLGTISMPIWKANALNQMQSLVSKNQKEPSCFVYGASPALYSTLNCQNPTKIFTVISDFYSVTEAKNARKNLTSEPPCFLITSNTWLAPGLDVKPDPNLINYEQINPEGQFIMHDTLHQIIDNYTMIYSTKDPFQNLKDIQKTFYKGDWENFEGINLYENTDSEACNK